MGSWLVYGLGLPGMLVHLGADVIQRCAAKKQRKRVANLEGDALSISVLALRTAGVELAVFRRVEWSWRRLL